MKKYLVTSFILLFISIALGEESMTKRFDKILENIVKYKRDKETMFKNKVIFVLITGVFVVCVFVSTLWATVNDQLETKTKEGVGYLEKGKEVYDLESLLKAQRIFEDLIAQYPQNYLYHYYLAKVNCEISNIFYWEKNDKNRARICVEKGIEEVKKSIELNDDYAEAHLLLATLYGHKIAYANSLKAILYGPKYGPKIEEEFERAFDLDPDNPDLYLQWGMSDLHKPKFFGGGTDKAIEKFKKALSLKPEFADAYICLGIAYKREGDIKRAKEYLEKALSISPNNRWAKIELEMIEK